MTNLIDRLEDDENRPEPPELKRARDLHETYRARFGEWAPKFGVPYATDDEELEAVERALKTGQRIKDQTPPGCVS